jgi:hypothetical protein
LLPVHEYINYITDEGSKDVDCVIAGFCREVDEMSTLLGYYAASSGNYLPTFLGFLTLEDGTDRLYQNVVKNYHYTLRNLQEKRRSQVVTCS